MMENALSVVVMYYLCAKGITAIALITWWSQSHTAHSVESQCVLNADLMM